MTLGITTRRRAKSRWLILGVIVAGLSLAGGPVAFANLSGSTFEGNDGNLLVTTAGNTDWANVAGLNVGLDNPSGSGDNAFGQGTKEDNAAVTVVDGSIPPNKNDLTRFYEASELAGNGHNYLYLAWERAVNIGNANMDFEVNQAVTAGFTGTTTGKITLNRTAGDLLVTYDFGGSGTPTLGLLFWVTTGSTSQCFASNSLPCWGNHVSLNGTNSEGAVNTGDVTDPIAPNAPRTLGVGLFGEAAIDLTAAGVFPAGTCRAFGSTFLKSRSSSSFGAELKDFIAPIPVNIANCGEFKIVKTSSKSGDTNSMAGATFSVTKDGTAITGSPFTTGSAGTVCITALATGTYIVTETAAPANYGIDDTSGHSVVVSSTSTCDSTSANYKHTDFKDTPLSKIQVIFSSLAGAGITNASIVCTTDSGATTVVAESEDGQADPALDDTDESFTNLVPGTYTCTVVVDP